MRLSPVEENLLKAIEDFEIVDAHEHLPPEKVRLEKEVDVFTLFSHYTVRDLWAAGMPTPHRPAVIHDQSMPIEKRWEFFAPYLKNIRYGSYARAAFIAAKEFYGFDDINETNYRALSQRIAEANTPGIYRRILRDKCKIRVALTQHNRTDYDLDLLMPLMPIDIYSDVRMKKPIEEKAANFGQKLETLDDYLELTRKGLEKWKSEGVVGIKMWSSASKEAPERREADDVFQKLMRNEEKEIPYGTQSHRQLSSFLREEIMEIAGQLGLVVAVHTGMWGDFRNLDPQHMIPILGRHPRTRFDIYHLGIPYVREAEIMGKNFPNVWLNLCWVHIISPVIARQAMDELIDLVPINKIIAFGGDYGLPVEKVYGHLVMARENIAKVLARRIEDGLLTENEAIDIAKKWFYNNPKELYQLKI